MSLRIQLKLSFRCAIDSWKADWLETKQRNEKCATSIAYDIVAFQ